jgi:hypothetical protein
MNSTNRDHVSQAVRAREQGQARIRSVTTTVTLPNGIPTSEDDWT